jgi:hypothetical protein
MNTIQNMFPQDSMDLICADIIDNLKEEIQFGDDRMDHACAEAFDIVIAENRNETIQLGDDGLDDACAEAFDNVIAKNRNETIQWGDDGLDDACAEAFDNVIVKNSNETIKLVDDGMDDACAEAFDNVITNRSEPIDEVMKKFCLCIHFYSLTFFFCLQGFSEELSDAQPRPSSARSSNNISPLSFYNVRTSTPVNDISHRSSSSSRSTRTFNPLSFDNVWTSTPLEKKALHSSKPIHRGDFEENYIEPMDREAQYLWEYPDQTCQKDCGKCKKEKKHKECNRTNPYSCSQESF